MIFNISFLSKPPTQKIALALDKSYIIFIIGQIAKKEKNTREKKFKFIYNL